MATSPERSGLRPVRSDAGAAPSWLGPELTGVFEGCSRAWIERRMAKVGKRKGHAGRSCARRAPHCLAGRGAESARDKLLQELESDPSEVTVLTMRHWITSFRLLTAPRI